MPRRLPKFCSEDTDRHGKVRVYFRRPGQPKVRLYGIAWTPGFMEQYERALNGTPASAASRKTKHGTWRWLCQQYFTSAEFCQQLESSTQTKRRQILESTFDEPIRPGASETFGDMPLGRFSKKAIFVLRDRKAKFPAAANARVKTVRLVLAYGVQRHEELVPSNSAREVPLFKTATGGHHTWSRDEVNRFMQHYPAGSKPRRAMALLLYTGARGSDVRLFGRQMIRDGLLHFQPKKTRKSSGATVDIPIISALAAELSLGPQDHLTYLVTEYGRPFSVKGFGNWFNGKCKAAGLAHCTAHGLRKAGATIAAENGATEPQLMAIFGWSDTQQAAHYIKEANRKRLANAVDLIDLEQKST